MNKEFEKLQKENEKIRTNISNLLKLGFKRKLTLKDTGKIWEKINNLVDNEIEQEQMCGQ